LKVALVCDRFDPAGGGLERWVAQLVPRLERRGHEVHVVAFRAAPGHAFDRLHVVAAPPGRLERARASTMALAALAPDVVHDTGVGWTYDVLHPMAGARMANHRRELASLPALARWRRRASPARWRWRRDVRELEHRQYRMGDGLVIACSSMVARDLATLHGVADARIRRVTNGVDVERFDPARCAGLRDAARSALGVDPATAVVLFAAHNPRLKGLAPLLRAAARLRDSGARLQIVTIGGAPDAAILQLVAALDLSQAFTHLGDVADPLPCFAAADAFALPTYYDACSLSVLEACACGLPAVTTRHNGVAELITHGRDGFVIDEPDDTATLAAAIGQAIAGDARLRIGPAARALALAHDFDRNVDGVEAAYVDALARRAGRRARA
jgi:UDP-glucose:(heptosyl)LPS alpha-1,3-glucosyltransferase